MVDGGNTRQRWDRLMLIVGGGDGSWVHLQLVTRERAGDR